jgi:radical SAM/Cys-rich protein
MQAAPSGKKIMPKSVMERIITFLRNHPGLCVDITGGCPELNPDFRFFVENVYRYACPLMVRTNLTVFFEAGLDWVPIWYSKHKVVLMASLPCYTPENVNKQRGDGTFNKSIAALRMLNELDYGRNPELQLHLVYNPNGDFLPGPQEQLEADYKKELNEKYGICFNRLFTMTNAPIGRFKKHLEANGRLKQYLQLLAENFNSHTAESIMCRNLISADYKGLLYNCDFNQALDLPIINKAGNPVTIEQLEDILSQDLEIITDNHCFSCTAGAGSSCTGSLVN